MTKMLPILSTLEKENGTDWSLMNIYFYSQLALLQSGVHSWTI